MVALREGAMLSVDGEVATLRGSGGGRLFRLGKATLELATGDRVDALA